MGYTTSLVGKFTFSRDLTAKETKIINDFADERHEGSQYPSYYCQWVTDGSVLEWDGNEKFYGYVEWLNYLIQNFFKPWGVTVSGFVSWFGEDPTDQGLIEVENNIVDAYEIEFKKGKKIK